MPEPEPEPELVDRLSGGDLLALVDILKAAGGNVAGARVTGATFEEQRRNLGVWTLEELAALVVARWNELVAAIRPVLEAIAVAVQETARSWSRAGLLPPDPTSARRGDRWDGLAGRYRLVVTKQRGAHWKPVGPTRERWWK